MPPHDWLWWLAGLLILAVIFPIVISLLATLSGWERLAGRYPLSGAFPKGGHRFQSMRLNNTTYRRVLRMLETPEGLYLVPMSLFRVDPPLCSSPGKQLRSKNTPPGGGGIAATSRPSPKRNFAFPPP